MSEKGNPPRGWGRPRPGAWFAVAVGLAALLVGTAAAATPGAGATSGKYVPPYSGSESASFSGESTGCGGSAAFPVPAFFDLTTGVATESVEATAHSCGSVDSTVYLVSSAGFTSSSFTGTAGVHHLRASLVLNFSVALAAKAGNGSQGARAAFAVYFELQLFDKTNGSVFYGSNYPAVYNSVASGRNSHSYDTVLESLYLNATLVKGHSYEFAVNILISVDVLVTRGTSSASASVNMGSGGRSAFIASVTDK